MGQPRRIRLTSVKTGEAREFETMTSAGKWLCRSHCYLQYCIQLGQAPSHGETLEEFILEDLGEGKSSVYSPMNRQRQLCNDCARASGFCSWSRNLTPVKGWEADVTSWENGVSLSWRVKNCPLYIRDAETRRERLEQRRMLQHG